MYCIHSITYIIIAYRKIYLNLTSTDDFIYSYSIDSSIPVAESYEFVVDIRVGIHFFESNLIVQLETRKNLTVGQHLNQINREHFWQFAYY